MTSFCSQTGTFRRNVWRSEGVRTALKYSRALGSEGFSSGKHSWEVEVGDHPDWNIGLAKESDRKGETFVTPKDGFWCLWQRSGIYMNGEGKPLTTKRNPQRIRVQLDYDRGEVSFYDPEDMTHIYTHEDTFTERLYPYFNVGPSGDAKTPDIKVCQADTCLSGKTVMSAHVCVCLR